MALTAWLIDKSALARLGSSPEAKGWASRIQRGPVSVSTVTRLEIGYSARTGPDLAQIFSTVPVASLLVEYFAPVIEERALEIQALLANRGLHRAPSLADLLLAATAEARKLTVLHLDKNFELIATVTGQPVEALRM